jgi:hypothetical protein
MEHLKETYTPQGGLGECDGRGHDYDGKGVCRKCKTKAE